MKCHEGFDFGPQVPPCAQALSQMCLQQGQLPTSPLLFPSTSSSLQAGILRNGADQDQVGDQTDLVVTQHCHC